MRELISKIYGTSSKQVIILLTLAFVLIIQKLVTPHIVYDKNEARREYSADNMTLADGTLSLAIPCNNTYFREFEIELEEAYNSPRTIDINYTSADGEVVTNSFWLRENEKTALLDKGLCAGSMAEIRLNNIDNVRSITTVSYEYEFNADKRRLNLLLIAITDGLLLVLLELWLFPFYKKGLSVAGKCYLAVNDMCSRIKPQQFFVIYAAILGIAFMVFLPFMHVPDEMTHIKMMTGSIGLSGFYDEALELDDVVRIEETISFNSKVRASEYLEMITRPLDHDALQYKPVFSLRSLSYIPAILGMLLGILLHLPTFFCVQLADIFNLAFAIVCGYYAIKMMPVKKELMCFALSMPMAVQQYASVNYDAILLPLIALFISYILALKYNGDDIGWKQMIFIMAMLAIIAAVKIPYVTVGILLFSLNAQQFKCRIFGLRLCDILAFLKKHFVITIITIALICAGGLYALRNVSFISVFITAFLNVPVSASLMKVTLEAESARYIETLFGSFGWLYVDVYKWMLWFGIILVLMLGLSMDEKKADIRTRLLMALYSVLIVLLIHFAMLRHTYMLKDLAYGTYATSAQALQSVNRIFGVQGRYFIPIVFASMFVWSGTLKIKGKQLTAVATLYYLLTFAVVIVLLCGKLWSL